MRISGTIVHSAPTKIKTRETGTLMLKPIWLKDKALSVIIAIDAKKA